MGGRASSRGASVDAEREQIEGQLRDVQRQLDRLVETASRTGNAPSVFAAITRRESEKETLQQHLDDLAQRPHLSDAAISRIGALARTKLADWRGTMRRNTPVAREVLGLLLRDRLTLTPQKRGRQVGYKFEATGTLAPLLAGLVAGSAQVGTSPAGFEPAFWP